MTKEQVYDAWASPDSPWAHWVKPVLFSFMGEGDLKARRRPFHPWNITRMERTALVIDCPGSESVDVGIECAKAGYRPIPLYNACPFATFDPDGNDFITSVLYFPKIDATPVVDMTFIMQALCETAETLSKLQLPAVAPPAFLLDANRRGHTLSPEFGSFDNRSVVWEGDFPSAEYLLRKGIEQVVVVQNQAKIEPDLLPVLLSWQASGITIARQISRAQWSPQRVNIRRPWLMAYLWQQFLIAFGYQRNKFGAYGRLVRSSQG